MNTDGIARVVGAGHELFKIVQDLTPEERQHALRIAQVLLEAIQPPAPTPPPAPQHSTEGAPQA